jgi:ATP-binding cassette, subfamily B, bacterial IrtB/YbtQ
MIGDLFTLAGEQKNSLIAGTILHVLATLFASAPYIFLYFIIKALFTEPLDLTQLWWLVAAIATSIVLQGIFLHQANQITYINSFRAIGSWRLKLGDRIRKLPMGFLINKQTGDLNSIISQDMRQIEAVPTLIYPKIVSGLTQLVAIVSFLFFVDWHLSLATIAGFPFAILLFLSSRKTTKRLTQNQKKAQISANSRIIEYIQGLAVLKAFSQAGKRFGKLEQALEEYKQANLAMVYKLALPSIAFGAALDFSLFILLVVGLDRFFAGNIPVFVFLLFAILSLRIYAPIIDLLDLYGSIRQMDAALARVTDVMQTKPLLEPSVDIALYRFDVEFKHVSFSYGNKEVLHDVSFRVPQHSITALVGPSGSGKTTITNLIARFWDVDSGEILIGGVNVKNLKTERLFSYIGIVFQDVYLFKDTIENNIKFGKPNATIQEIIEAAKAAQCHEFIQNLPQQYHSVIGEGGATLSGGEKQRIAIARAILKDAPIILLDEATASLDPENEIAIQQAINSLVENKTLIIIAHSLATITRAEQILVLDRGEIIQRGTHQQLLAEGGLYQKFWQEKAKAANWQI